MRRSNLQLNTENTVSVHVHIKEKYTPCCMLRMKQMRVEIGGAPVGGLPIGGWMEGNP
jgi:hypothetical protein